LIEQLERRLLLSSQPYVWQNAAIGAGGFVDGIFYSPTQSGVVYARTDIGGLYKSTNDGASWQELLDFAGPNGTQQQLGVLSFAIDPENPNYVYADTGQYTGENGWLLYSTNGGQTFNTTNLPFYVGGNENGRATGERLAVDPSDSNILFLGSNNDGLWMSTDAGTTALTQVTSFPSAAGTAGITFVTFGTPNTTVGDPTQTILVGVDSTAAGTNLYETTNGGSTWTEVSGAGAPTGWIPQRAELASDGNMYITYANALPPSGTLSTGGVYRFNLASGASTNVTPLVPGSDAANDTFGYVGLAVDPENPAAVVVTSFDRYNSQDQIWRSANANSASPTWTALFDITPGNYGGFNPTRNTSDAPWVAAFDDGIGNWAATVAIDPFNSSQLMYGTGQGLWLTNDATSSTTLTGANSWYFPDVGIEFTEVFQVKSPPSGAPLLSAMADINGFVHTTLTSSPALGADLPGGTTGTSNSIDFAQNNPNFLALVESVGTHDGGYSTNDGATWTEFAANPGSGGTVAVSANGATIVWAPSGKQAYYSTNDGSTWTESTGGPSGGTVAADRVNSSVFYLYSASALYLSTNGGATFTKVYTAAATITSLVVNPSVSGDVWIGLGGSGLYHSTNATSATPTFTRVASGTVQNAQDVGLGKAAPTESYDAIFIYGEIGGVFGFYRSDDEGATWVGINNSSQEFGQNINGVAGDPNVYGRIYVAVNGRGIEFGDPASSLPSGWTDQDINAPGNPGFSTSSTTLSNGTTVNQWTVEGGGAGIGGTSDQFNFAYLSNVSSDFGLRAQVTGLSNPNGTTPQAGIMIRGGTDASDAFAAIVQTPTQIVFQWRTSAGGTMSSTAVSVPLGSNYLELDRNGNNFTAYYSTNGTTWTQVGTTEAITMTTAYAGLAVTADDNRQVATGTFNDVVLSPAVANQYFFYYGSSAFDDSDTAPGAEDYNAIATDKTALLPGGAATFSNVSSYLDGINGILIAFANLPAGVTFSASDFQFAVGNNSTPSSWAPGPAPASVATWTRNGETYADIVWANGAIRDEWLQVTVKSGGDADLASPDVFYFGSLVGATGASVTSTSNGPLLQATSADVEQTELNLSEQNTVPITNLYDFDRNGQVTSTDVEYAELNLTEQSGLELINLDSPGPAVASVKSKGGSTISAAAATISNAPAAISTSAIDDSSSTMTSVLNQNGDVLGRVVRHHR